MNEIDIEYDILTKKIHAKFYRISNLLMNFIQTSWHGEIFSVGDVVIQENTNTPIYINRHIDVSRKREDIFDDVEAVNDLANDMASEIKEKVEADIASSLYKKSQKDNYKYNVNFASNVIRQGGYISDDKAYYSCRFVYGFEILPIK